MERCGASVQVAFQDERRAGASFPVCPTAPTSSPSSIRRGDSRVNESDPAVVVECWCSLVSIMDRLTLNRFMRDISGWFEHQDLKPLKAEVLRRREELAAGENSGGDRFDACA